MSTDSLEKRKITKITIPTHPKTLEKLKCYGKLSRRHTLRTRFEEVFTWIQLRAEAQTLNYKGEPKNQLEMR